MLQIRNSAVEEVISKIVSKPDFAEAVKSELNSEVDTSETEKELELLRKRRNQLVGAKNKLANQIDSLDITDKHYDQKYQDMQ